jgi:hypothetical protein
MFSNTINIDMYLYFFSMNCNNKKRAPYSEALLLGYLLLVVGYWLIS